MDSTSCGLCECGCGLPTTIARYNNRRYGYVAGKPRRFVKGHSPKASQHDYTVRACGYKTPCWVWNGRLNDKGYGWAKGRKGGLAHRRLYEMMRGPVPEGMELDHLCRNRACVNPDHLEPVTHEENMRRGTYGKAKLTREQADQIRVSGLSAKVEAARYGVCVSTIYYVRRGATWKE